jgi:O-antigen ligase
MCTSEKFIGWCDRVMAFAFYALIYFLPISIALSESFTGLAIFSYLLKRGAVFCGLFKDGSQGRKTVGFFFRNLGKAFKPVSSFLNVPIFIIVIISLVSTIKSQYHMVSLEGFVGKVLESAFLYFTFIECMRSEKRLRIFFTIFLISCALISINGIYQSLAGHEFIFGQLYDGRVSSSFRHANDFGAYLVVVVPVLFCLTFLMGRKRREAAGKTKSFVFLSSGKLKVVSFILFMLTLACLGLTYSRGAWLGFVLSLFLMGLLRMKDYKVPLVFGFLIMVFLGVFYPLMSKERPRLKDIKSSLAANNRFGYWRRTQHIIKDYPVFGCGLNTYSLVEGRYSIGWGGYPHNSYLQMTAETGIVGISAFLWMIYVLFSNSLKALRRMEVQAHRMLFFGFLTGLAGFLIHSFFDTNFYSVQLGSFMWTMIGVVVALQSIEVA